MSSYGIKRVKWNRQRTTVQKLKEAVFPPSILELHHELMCVLARLGFPHLIPKPGGWVIIDCKGDTATAEIC